jgi:putative membrane protein
VRAVLNRGLAAAAVALASVPALAHDGHAVAEPRWEPWDTVFAVALLASVGFYAGGVRRLWRSPSGRQALRPWRVGAFGLGWLALAVALASPLDPLSDALFSAHMTQHELLMLMAAPLFVLARPGIPLLWALPWRARERVAARLRRPWFRGAWRALTGPVVVFLLHGVALWVWHAPVLFEAALRNQGVHAVQHAMFFWTAVLFWYALVHGRYGRLGYGAAVLFVFLTGVHSGILGALLTWAPRVWYRTYEGRTEAYGWSALEDQQLAGLIMWVPVGAVFLVVGLAFFAAWLAESEKRSALTRTAAIAQGRGEASHGS